MDVKEKICALRTDIGNSLMSAKKQKKEFLEGFSLPAGSNIAVVYTAISELNEIEKAITVLEGQLDVLDQILLTVFEDEEADEESPAKHLYEVGVMYDGRYQSIKLAACSSEEAQELVEDMVPNKAKEWTILHVVEGETVEQRNSEQTVFTASKEPPEVIKEFQGDHHFLSNFFISPHPFIYGGVVYKTAEAAFQSCKSLDASIRRQIAALSAPEAKRAGRRVSLRPDWEEVKDDLMTEILEAKFSDPTLRKKLLETGDAVLIEGNTWGDIYWGVDIRTNTGENRLGKILMSVRDNFAKCNMWVYEIYLANGGYIRLRSGRTFHSERDGETYTFLKLVFDESADLPSYPIIALRREGDGETVMVTKEWFYDTRIFF